MGTRSAPLVFLLLAACVATGGTDSAVRDGSGPAPGSAAGARSAPSAGLPAIPRMRPKAPRKVPSAGAASAQAGGAVTDTVSRSGGAEVPAPGQPGAAAGTGSGQEMAATGPANATDAADALNAGPDLPPDKLAGAGRSSGSGLSAGDARAALMPGADASSAFPGPVSELEFPPSDPAGGISPGMDGGTAGAGSDSGPETELAIAIAPEIDPGIDVESLFDGDVVRYCAAMWRMGEYIGAARRRGEPFKRAIGDSVRRIAAEKQLPLDNRLAFSGQVYGRLVYRLEDSHAALTLGTYVHFACLTVRGDKKIVPADPNAERLLNAGLARCENTAFTRDTLNDCIFRELTPIVDRRNS